MIEKQGPAVLRVLAIFRCQLDLVPTLPLAFT